MHIRSYGILSEDFEPIRRLEILFNDDREPVDTLDEATWKYVTIISEEGEIEEQYSIPIIEGVDLEFDDFDEQKKILESFNEEDHPRGQPDNAGQFVSKDKQVDTTQIRERGKTVSRNLYSDMIRKYNTEIKGTIDDRQWHNDLSNPINSNEKLKAFEEAKEEWNKFLDSEPKFKEQFEELKKDTNEYNEMLDEKFENAKVFYRGTSMEELDSYVRDNCIGCDFMDQYSGGKGKLYDFVSLSMDTTELGLFNHGVIVEYEADSIKEVGGTKTNYSAEPTPFLAQFSGKKPKGVETVSSPNSLRFAEEQEVRIPVSDMSKVKIKKIHIDMSKIEGQLRSKTGMSQFTEIDDFGKGKDIDIIVEKLKEKYGKLTDNFELHTKSLIIGDSGDKWFGKE